MDARQRSVRDTSDNTQLSSGVPWRVKTQRAAHDLHSMFDSTQVHGDLINVHKHLSTNNETNT